MKAKEVFIASIIWISGIGLFESFLLSSIPEKVNQIHSDKQRIIMASNALMQNSNPGDCLDGRLDTSWKIKFQENPPASNKSHVPDENSNYLQMQLFITHFPGNPPGPNPLKEILLWPGSYNAGTFSKKYARPARIRLVFFEQELVDVDREFRLAPPPFFIYEKFIEIPDREGPFSIKNDFLPDIKVSRKFPDQVFQIWMRIEILKIHPGETFTDEISISEVDYRTSIPEHSVMQGKISPEYL